MKLNSHKQTLLDLEADVHLQLLVYERCTNVLTEFRFPLEAQTEHRIKRSDMLTPPKGRNGTDLLYSQE